MNSKMRKETIQTDFQRQSMEVTKRKWEKIVKIIVRK